MPLADPIAQELDRSLDTATLLANDLRGAHREACEKHPVLALHLEGLLEQAERIRQQVDRAKFAYHQEVAV